MAGRRNWFSKRGSQGFTAESNAARERDQSPDNSGDERAKHSETQAWARASGSMAPEERAENKKEAVEGKGTTGVPIETGIERRGHSRKESWA